MLRPGPQVSLNQGPCLRVLRDAAASQLYKHLSINSDTCARARARTADNCGVGHVAADSSTYNVAHVPVVLTHFMRMTGQLRHFTLSTIIASTNSIIKHQITGPRTKDTKFKETIFHEIK